MPSLSEYLRACCGPEIEGETPPYLPKNVLHISLHDRSQMIKIEKPRLNCSVVEAHGKRGA